MTFIHIESILNVNEFNYNLPNYCILNIIKLKIFIVFIYSYSCNKSDNHTLKR